jgi:endonuclease VIII
MRPILAGRVPDELLTPHPRCGAERWLAGAGGPHVRAGGGLLTAARVRFDQRIAGLGPDIIGPRFGEAERARFLSRLREDDPTRPIGDALLDQRTIAGIGNPWKLEGCFAAGIDPWRPTGRVSDEEALRIVDLTRPRMQRSAQEGNQTRFRTIYGRTERPCPRWGGRIRQRGQGDGSRPTYWCPECRS